MNGLFDKNKIPDIGKTITESYIGYGKNDLHEMNEKELKAELSRTNNEIKSIEDEIEDANSFPSFALKEKLDNAYYYRDKVIDALSKYKKESTCYIDEMLTKLNEDYNNGNISKEYYESYRDKLNYKREVYNNRIKDEKEQARLQLLKEEALNKKPFRKFKNKLKDYAKQ